MYKRRATGGVGQGLCIPSPACPVKQMVPWTKKLARGGIGFGGWEGRFCPIYLGSLFVDRG